MRPVARVRGSSGSRSAAGFGDARAATLRNRFEQLMQGSGPSARHLAQAVPGDGAPPPPPGRGEKLDAVLVHSQAMPQGAAPTRPQNVETAPPLATAREQTRPDTCHGIQTQADGNADAARSRRADKPSSRGTMAEAAAAPLPPAALASVAPSIVVSMPTAAKPLLDTLPAERATPARTARAQDGVEPVAVLPPSQTAPASPADAQAQSQSLQPTARDREQRDMPELVRDLVQAVVHLSRGREGQWRLTMALKPQVLEGTVVALQAQPGQLQVRFDCLGADACARLAAVQDDLRTRLSEALSTARPVDVRVDVQAPKAESVHGLA